MQYLVSRNEAEAGTNRPLNIELFRSRELVLAFSNQAAVDEYARLVKGVPVTQVPTRHAAFSNAFGPYFAAPHDIADWAAAADRYIEGWPEDMDGAAPEVRAAKVTADSLVKALSPVKATKAAKSASV